MAQYRADARRSYGHVVAGLVMVGLGSAGLVSFWGALGHVARGFVPFAVFAAGLVMVAAGARALRDGRAVVEGAVPVLPIVATAACIILMATAAGGLEVDLPRSWTPTLVAGYAALGFVSGIVGGMLGLGGGLVHLSGLTLLFGVPFSLARGATLINNVFINGAAAFRYGRRGMLLAPVVLLLLPATLIGVAGGSLLQTGFSETLMRRIFAVFVVLVTVAIVVDTLTWARRCRLPVRPGVPAVRHGTTGAIAGLLSGVLGISGGVVAVPGQTLAGGVPLRSAIANSTLTTALSSLVGSLMLLVPIGGGTPSISEMATIAVLFVPGNVIGGHFGAVWMERLPAVAVRGFFITALIAIAVRSWTVSP